MKHEGLHEMTFTKLTHAVITLKDLKMFEVALLGLWVLLFLFLYLLNVYTRYEFLLSWKNLN